MVVSTNFKLKHKTVRNKIMHLCLYTQQKKNLGNKYFVANNSTSTGTVLELQLPSTHHQ